MIAYLDTSAVVPILIAEPSTQRCREVWDEADGLVTSQLTFVEVAAALAAAQRAERITPSQRRRAWANFEHAWPDIDVLDLTAELCQSAAGFAWTQALRGYDAVHCASAHAVSDPDLVAVSGDAQLLGAWHRLGIAVLDTNAASLSEAKQ